MFRKILDRFRPKAAPISVPLQLPPKREKPPYTIRISIPIKEMDSETFCGYREEFVIESFKKQISYSQILDCVCHIDDDDDYNHDMWRIENALETVIAVEYADRQRLNKEIGDNGLRCPVTLKLADNEKVPTYIEVMVD